MATNSGKKARRAEATNTGFGNPNTQFKSIQPLNYIQGVYLEAIRNNEIVFGVGAAGTGKTYVAAGYAAEQLFYRKVNKVFLTRPVVEVGNSLGFLPGTIEEKYAPYLMPFDAVFGSMLGKGMYESMLKSKTIEPMPLGFMRGCTLSDCIVLVDEAQNLRSTELRMLLTRLGKNAKIIFSGDSDQTDIKDSGLAGATRRLQGIEGIETVHFMDEDIVRNKLIKSILMAYRN